MSRETDWLRDNSCDKGIQEAVHAGWNPPNVEKAIDWWAERASLEPDEAEEIIEDLLRDLPEDKLMKRLLSYYSVEADNFLSTNKLTLRVEAMKWLEERNREGEFLNRHSLRVEGSKPKDCGRKLVRILYIKGARKVEALPIKVPYPNCGEYADTLFVGFPDDWSLRMKLWVYITNLHPKEVELESEGPVVVRVTFWAI